MLEIKYTFDKLKWAHPIRKRFVGNVTGLNLARYFLHAQASLRLGAPKIDTLETSYTLDKLDQAHPIRKRFVGNVTGSSISV
jgi:hypothetical protein